MWSPLHWRNQAHFGEWFCATFALDLEEQQCQLSGILILHPTRIGPALPVCGNAVRPITSFKNNTSSSIWEDCNLLALMLNSIHLNNMLFLCLYLNCLFLSIRHTCC